MPTPDSNEWKTYWRGLEKDPEFRRETRREKRRIRREHHKRKRRSAKSYLEGYLEQRALSESRGGAGDVWDPYHEGFWPIDEADH